MIDTYKFFASLAQTWGLAYFVTVFAAAVAYALWPSNKSKFEDAAQLPLRED